jgi:hypothetical protein
MGKGVNIVGLRQEKAKCVGQNASSYSYYVASVASSSWALDVENCGQSAKNGFDCMTEMSQSLLHTFRPLIFLVIFAQGHQQDIAFAQQARFQFGVL